MRGETQNVELDVEELLFSAYQREIHLDEKSLDAMRESSALARHVLQVVEAQLCEGISTEEIDLIVFNEIVRCGAYPSPLGYRVS